MGSVTETTPFAGAQTCYRRAYRLLAWMGQNGHIAAVKKGGRTIGSIPSDEMTRLTTALNDGDEGTVKWFLVHPDYIGIVHAA